MWGCLKLNKYTNGINIKYVSKMDPKVLKTLGTYIYSFGCEP